MSILTTCDGCGKKIKMDDKRIGTMIKCPVCKATFKVPPAGTGRTIKIKQQAKDQKDKSKVSINWGPMMAGAGALAVLGFIAMIYFGPVQAKQEWDGISEEASDTILDVVQRGLMAEVLADMDPADLAKKATPPQVHDVHMFWKPWVLSMPESVEFKGTSTQGGFKGQYYPENGEVEAVADIGGTVVPGLDEVTPGDRKIKITGRRANGKLDVEINGKKAVLPDPKAAKAAEDVGAAAPAPGDAKGESEDE